MIRFYEETHQYVTEHGEIYESVSSLISKYKQPFDEKGTALTVSRKKTSKWYNMQPEEIIAVWQKEKNRACELGKHYHSIREKALLGCNTINHGTGYNLQIVKPEIREGVKYALPQVLLDGIYPEHLMYLDGAKKAGQADYVEVYDGFINISDYKTNKEIKTEGFKMWNGKSKKMLGPLRHLDDINFNHYSLQLSAYMFMIMKHNPQLIPGKMIIEHVMFEEEKHKDKYGYPITIFGMDGPIIKDVVKYEVPYLKFEINQLMYGNKTV